MTVVAPPPQTEADERTLDERVADLEALIEEARQRTRRRRRRNGAVALAALLAAGAALYAGGDDIGIGRSSGDRDGHHQALAGQTPSQSLDPVAEPVWGFAYVSDPVTFDDMAQNLRTQGLGAWVELLHEKWGDIDGRIRLELDRSNFTASIPGTPVSQTNSYLLLNSELFFAESALEAAATELDGGGQRLTLTLRKSDGPPIDGIPGEVYERALYTTVPFNEIPPSYPAPSPGTYESGSHFGRAARNLRGMGLDNSVEQLRKMWGDAEGPVRIRLELDGDTATVSIPGTQLIFTGPYGTDGSLIRLEDDDPRDDEGWLTLKTLPPTSEGAIEFGFWDAGPAVWDGLPAKVIAATLFEADPFKPAE